MRIKGLNFAYETEPVIKNVALDIHPGDFVGIIGPNGSGKSTLLKLMLGILPGQSGEIFYKNHPLADYKRKHLARLISWIPQENPLVFPFKVSEIVLMGRHPYSSALVFENQEDYRIAGEAMELTRTAQFADRSFNEISGGEKQRVMIASAIAQQSEMMLLDEPTSALDIKYQMEILKILQRLNQDNNLTLVMTMHDLHLASKFCRKLVLLDEGRIAQEGGPVEVLREDIIEKVYGVKVTMIKNPDDGSWIVSPRM